MDNVGNQVTNVTGQTGQPVAQVAAQVAQQPVAKPQMMPAQNSQALFTQEQLNSIISGRINPLNQKISDLNNQLAEEQKLSASYLNELNGYKNRESATKAGVPAQFLDFAIFEASKLAVNGKTFDDAIKEYVSSNQSLFGVSTQGVQGSASATPSVQQPTGASATPTQTPQQQQAVVNPQPQAQPQVQSQVIVGSTGVQGAGNPANTANVDTEVDAFLRARGLRK